MKISDDTFQSILNDTQFGTQDRWFGRQEQKQLAFRLAYDLVVDGMSPSDAIDTAKEFIELFYNRAVKRGVWE